MALKSTQDRFGTVAITIHWLAAALIVALLISGFRVSGAADPAAKAAFLRFHAVMGIAILALTLGRIAWWWFADRKPLPVAGQPPLLRRAASAVHLVFYILIVGLAASGIGMMIVSGAGPIVFGGASGALPDFWTVPPRIPHGIGVRVLIALLILHVAGALYHHFIRGDRLLARMGVGR
ncbi:MAG: cytochrome b [Pseudorhodoplanes sp.]